MLVYYSTFIFEIVFNNLYSNEGASTMYSGFSIFVFNRLNLYSYPSWYVNSLIAFRESNTISNNEFVNSWCSVVCAQYGRKVALLVL